MNLLLESPFFGIALSVIAYCIGMWIQRKVNSPLCNGLVIAALLVIGVLLLFDISYDAYFKGGTIIQMMLGPATTCMAVSIYAKWDLLKKNLIPVLAGCLAGAVTAVVSVWALCRLFGLDATMTISMLPKSVTTAIATAISETQGGVVSITAIAVIITGIGGNIAAPFLVKLFRLSDPLAIGLGLGTCSHAIGTAKAMEFGETEGAMAGLAMSLCGIITAVIAMFFGILI